MAPRVEAYYPPVQEPRGRSNVALNPDSLVPIYSTSYPRDSARISEYIKQMDAIWNRLGKGTFFRGGQELPLSHRQKLRLERTFNILRFHLEHGPRTQISWELVNSNSIKHKH